MKGKSIYLSREEAFQVAHIIANVIKKLYKSKYDEYYYLESTPHICFDEDEINTIKKVFKKLPINLTLEEF